MAFRKDSLRGKKSSRRRRSASSEDSDDDNPDSSMSATDDIPSANATDIAHEADVHQLVDNESKDLDAERHAPLRKQFPKSESDRIRTASVNEPYIFLRAVSVLKKPYVFDKGKGKAEKAAPPDRAPQSAAVNHDFRYDTQRLEKIFADMDHRLRSKKFKRSGVYNKCPSRTLLEVETRSMQILRESEMAFSQKTKVSSKTMESTNSTPLNPDEEGAGSSQARMQTRPSRSSVIGVPLGANDKTEMPEAEAESEEPSVELTKLDLERQKRFLKLAKVLFTYFLPIEFNSVLVAKYWGAVYVLIEVITPILILVPMRPFMPCLGPPQAVQSLGSFSSG